MYFCIVWATLPSTLHVPKLTLQARVTVLTSPGLQSVSVFPFSSLPHLCPNLHRLTLPRFAVGFRLSLKVGYKPAMAVRIPVISVLERSWEEDQESKVILGHLVSSGQLGLHKILSQKPEPDKEKKASLSVWTVPLPRSALSPARQASKQGVCWLCTRPSFASFKDVFYYFKSVCVCVCVGLYMSAGTTEGPKCPIPCSWS